MIMAESPGARTIELPGWIAKPVVRVLHMNRFHLPGWIRKMALRRLFILTARAFGSTVPDLSRQNASSLLTRYALFTREQANAALGSEPGPAEVMDRLYQQSRALGSQLRRILHLSTEQDVIRVSQLMYAILGIAMHGGCQGKVTITRCFFSTTYTPDVCRVISALDAGIASGLSAGRELVFNQRITEGRDSCDAVLQEVHLT